MLNKRKAYTGLVIITILWGISFPVMNDCLTKMGPFTFVAMRYLIAAIGCCFIPRKSGTLLQRETLKSGLYIGIPFAVAGTVQMIGLGQTSVTNASFLTGLTVVFVPAVLFLKDKRIPSKWTIVGCMICFFGIVIMANVQKFYANIGDLWILLSAMAFSIQIYNLEKYGQGRDPVAMTTIILWVVVILALPFAVFKEGMVIQWDLYLVLELFFVGVICTVWAIFIQNKLQPYVLASHAAIIYMLEPVAATVLAFFLGEKMKGYQIIGGAFILCGTLVIVLFDKIKE